MAKIRIQGKFTSTTSEITKFSIEEDCQTCGGTFDITIPYDLTKPNGTEEKVMSKATSDASGARTIVAKDKAEPRIGSAAG